eukprot:TRINITY_DN1347_c0_g3_i1.p1 TRINITY_DN1347_c0_g3~~TRINITY_DN1347_c0_g3_i1.p1  ORF type:complete len:168 (-),score=29.51 TRINITY_DN1347_c0_g3_i1:574-1077(-)
MKQSRRRSNSEEVNKNVEWLSSKGFWFFYILSLIIGRLSAGMFFVFIGISDMLAWTIINCLHAVGTFYFVHWIRGTPISDDQGMYQKYTFWEQIDDGRQYTVTRKLFILVPVVISVLACVEGGWSFYNTAINFSLLVFQVVPKLHALHGVRLFGINKEPEAMESKTN